MPPDTLTTAQLQLFFDDASQDLNFTKYNYHGMRKIRLQLGMEISDDETVDA